MDSKLDIESEPNKGSIFSFELELKSEFCDKHVQINQQNFKNALIVEDNQKVSEILKSDCAKDDNEINIENIRHINFILKNDFQPILNTNLFL